MARSLPSIVLFLAIVQIRGQSTATLVTNLVDCVPANEFQPGIDYFPEKFTPLQYSPHFASDEFIPDATTDFLTIDYYNTYKIVTNKHVNKTYLLYQCGTVPPADEVAGGKHHLVLPIPHKGGIAVTETPQVVPLEMLGKRQEIIAYMTDPTWLASPCVNTMIDAGDVEVVYDETGTNQDALNAEFLKRNPDAIIYSGAWGNPDADRTITVSYTKERTNVASFDWLALHAALFNLERESNRIAAEVKARYDCSAANAVQLSADRADRPKVLWAIYFDGLGWSLGECPTWDHTWYCELAEHCGAEIIQRPEGVGTKDEYGFWYLDDEQLLGVGKDAEIFFYPMTTWDVKYNNSTAILGQFKSVQNKRVYDILGVGKNAWSEYKAYEYDIVALDFCEIVGNGNDKSQFAHQVKWFRDAMNNGTSSDLGACPPEDVNRTLVADAAFCEPLPAASTANVVVVSTASAVFGIATLMAFLA